MDIEAEKIIANISDKKVNEISKIKYVCGNIDNKEVVVAVSGVGKVNAAVCTQTMILEYHPNIIINSGVAGSVDGSVCLFDAVVATSVVQHDYDNTPAVGGNVGEITGIGKAFFECDKEASELLSKCVKEVSGDSAKTGIIATGDQFIASSNKKTELHVAFNACACEMEGGSIGHVCYLNDTPFCVLRTISDNANSGSYVDYPEFSKKSADIASQILLSFIREYKI